MSDNNFTLKGFVVWTLCAMFFLYEFFLRVMMGTYQSPISEDLVLSSFEFSLVSSTIFMLVYSMMQLPVGIIVDNVGLKRALSIAIIACSMSSFGFAYSYSYHMALICRTFMGFGAGFGFVCLLISVYQWMPKKYNALFIGLSQFIGTLGPMLATGPLESISGPGGLHWRSIFVILGCIGLGMLILTLLFVENNKQTTGQFIILKRPKSALKSAKRLFYKVQPWYIAVLSMCLYFTVEYLSENEGRSFLALKGIKPESAGYLLTIAWIGFGVACPLYGFFSDLLHRRKSVMTAAAIIGLVSMCTILYLPNDYIYFAFFGLGVSAGGQSIGFANIAEHFQKQFVAVGYGLNNTIIVLGAAINAPIIGYILDNIKVGAHPTLEEYTTAFSILVGLLVLAVVVSVFFIEETFCKSKVEFNLLKVKKN